MLKPALARGELRCVGATTPDEYRRYIREATRRWPGASSCRVTIDEPVASTTRCRSCAASRASTRCITGFASPTRRSSRRRSSRRAISATGACPDKAIDLVDEAVVRACASRSTAKPGGARCDQPPRDAAPRDQAARGLEGPNPDRALAGASRQARNRARRGREGRGPSADEEWRTSQSRRHEDRRLKERARPGQDRSRPRPARRRLEPGGRAD